MTKNLANWIQQNLGGSERKIKFFVDLFYSTYKNNEYLIIRRKIMEVHGLGFFSYSEYIRTSLGLVINDIAEIMVPSINAMDVKNKSKILGDFALFLQTVILLSVYEVRNQLNVSDFVSTLKQYSIEEQNVRIGKKSCLFNWLCYFW